MHLERYVEPGIRIRIVELDGHLRVMLGSGRRPHTRLRKANSVALYLNAAKVEIAPERMTPGLVEMSILELLRKIL